MSWKAAVGFRGANLFSLNGGRIRLGRNPVKAAYRAGARGLRHLGLCHVKTIIIETERGEHAAIKVYDEALSGVLPPTVIDLLEAQREEMRETQKGIRELTQAL